MQANDNFRQSADLSAFKPAWWLKNCHLQTIFAKYLAPKIPLSLTAELIDLPDGDELLLHWGAKKPDPQTPLVLLLHGLEGNYRSHYIRGMMHSLQQHGFATVLMHFRGCHGEANKLPRAYHSGDTADAARVAELVKYARETFDRGGDQSGTPQQKSLEERAGERPVLKLTVADAVASAVDPVIGEVIERKAQRPGPPSPADVEQAELG